MRVKFVVFVLFVLLSSCNNQPSSGSSTNASASSAQIKYPNGWPISQLIVPSQSTPYKIVDLVSPDEELLFDWVNKENGIKEECWAVGFQSNLDWKQVVQHTESCLYPLGFTVSDVNDSNAPTLLKNKYTLDSENLIVTIGYNRRPKQGIRSAHDGYYYRIQRFNK